MDIRNITLNPEEIQEIENLLDSILKGQQRIDISEFLLEALIYSHKIPERLRRCLYQFKLTESSLGVCIRNNPIAHEYIGPTPQHFPKKEDKEFITREDVLHLLYSCLLGEPFSWTSIQNGYIINQIIPIPEHQDKIMSSGSNRLFDLHTEDAFHRYAGDYLGLMCLRNPSRIPTIISAINGNQIEPKIWEILFEPRFLVGSNEAHAVEQVKDLVPILFGHRENPYMRINLNLTKARSNDSEAISALNVFISGLRKNKTNLVLESGDCCFLDNFRVAHGRGVYSPRYDGEGRWLKRIYITCDLRKSRGLRISPESRLIKPENEI